MSAAGAGGKQRQTLGPPVVRYRTSMIQMWQETAYEDDLRLGLYALLLAESGEGSIYVQPDHKGRAGAK
jgi:hypothetical protein